MLHYDKVLKTLGEFGTHQKRLCVFAFILCIPNGIFLTSSVFQNVTPDFRCAVPSLLNDSFTILDDGHERLVKASIPMDSDGEHFSQCKVYQLKNNLTDSGIQTSDSNTTMTAGCERWVFDDKGPFSQVVEFSLVCDRAMYKAHGNLMLLLGMLVGSLVGGSLSDFFGRKKTLIISTILQSVVGSVMALAESYPMIMAMRFLLTVTGSTAFMAIFVLLAETVGVSKRSIATMATMLGFTAGTFVMTLVQFAFRDWKTAQLIQSLPFVSYVVFWWLIQESPRWLLTKHRQKEAEDVITRIANVNGVTLTPETELVANTDMMKSRDEKDCDAMTTSNDSKEVKIWQICASPRIIFRLSILCFSWVTINLVYYGLVLGVGELIQGDLYVNFALQAAMEVISHVTCVFILERISRKKIFCSTMILSGLATLGIGFLELATQGITIGFSLIYIITTELLPTKIRNSGLGFCSFVARFSGIVSPYIVSASLLIPGAVGKAFPVLLFGVLSVTSGLSAILLPETRNAKLPETFDDEDYSNNNTPKC